MKRMLTHNAKQTVTCAAQLLKPPDPTRWVVLLLGAVYLCIISCTSSSPVTAKPDENKNAETSRSQPIVPTKDTSTKAEREIGTVKWFNAAKGYGFIARKEGEDIFVHFSAIQAEGYRTLSEGEIVEFTPVRGPKGLQAENVRVVREKD